MSSLSWVPYSHHVVTVDYAGAGGSNGKGGVYLLAGESIATDRKRRIECESLL